MSRHTELQCAMVNGDNVDPTSKFSTAAILVQDPRRGVRWHDTVTCVWLCDQ
jgi:hypothetical protein